MHHQSDDDWFCIGKVALDASDLNAQLHALQEKAFALENNLSCKVVIPAEQVRFLSVETDGQPLEEDAKQKLAEGTPYTVEDLIFDTKTVGPTTYVAAVTRQTLDEARDFATEHGFIPVQFTADTDPKTFPSEPLFTPSESAPQVTEAKDVGQSDSVAPNVHPIAEEAAPDVFRSAPTATAPRKIPTEIFAKRYAVPAVATLGIAAVLGVWVLVGSNDTQTPEPDTAQIEDALTAPAPQASVTSESPTEPETPTTETAELDPDVALPEQEPSTQIEEDKPDLSPTDTAILEALNVAPTVVGEVARDLAPQDTSTQPGLEIIAPDPLLPPALPPQDELYLASVDNSNLSTDAIALPAAQSLATDAPVDQVALPSIADTRFELDDRGLVAPSAEGTMNPDGIVVYLGRPSKVPPEPPVRFEAEPTPEEAPDDRLAGLRPKPRPDNLIEQFERQQLGGRTRQELAGRRPKLRPASLQQQQQPQIDETPTALAVVRVPRPKSRPAGLAPPTGTQTANLGSTAAISQVEAGSFQPKAVAPKIPSAASVARQATIDNALNLRKLNLIGVYGTPANRRALVRLPSGRYKKLKVGDRVDGGKVIAIGDSELRYQKKGRNLTLKMPRG